MYSDMSTRISADASANRNLARARASSVLPTPVGPEKTNEPIGRLGSLSPARRPPDGAGHRLDGLVLAHDRPVDLVLHAEEPRCFGLLQPGDRNAGPAGDDEGDGLLVDGGPAGLPLPLPLLLLEPDLVLQLALLVAERRRALEVLVADRLLLEHVHLVELLLELGHLGRRHVGREPRPRAGLVDHVDRLVRQEPVGDVALRQLGRRRQRRDRAG